jgi:E3 ubiquitin-protein ligase HUWE1
MLTFVHNEPTSLTILQENKIPDAFYDAIEGEIEPSLDVLSAIPTAIGALCLNEAGLKQFLDTRLGIIKKFFDVFQSEPHARVLNERENAVVIGANFDELVRHHPDLKQSVFDAVTEVLKSLYEKGKDYVPESSDGYRLVQVAGGEGDTAAPQETLDQARSAEAASIMGDVSMSDTPATGAAQAGSAEQAEDAVEAKKEDNKMLTFIAVTGRVRVLPIEMWTG